MAEIAAQLSYGTVTLLVLVTTYKANNSGLGVEIALLLANSVALWLARAYIETFRIDIDCNKVANLKKLPGAGKGKLSRHHTVDHSRRTAVPDVNCLTGFQQDMVCQLRGPGGVDGPGGILIESLTVIFHDVLQGDRTCRYRHWRYTSGPWSACEFKYLCDPRYYMKHISLKNSLSVQFTS